MLTFNFNDLPQGKIIDGGLTFIRVILTCIKLRLLGHKPVIHRKVKIKGFYVQKGIAKEPLVKFNFWFFGWKSSSFHDYNRNGKPRVTQTRYVPIKTFLIQKKVA
tara:strand:+ start:50 stop:364 length:315 start_codon:yes stop_codon:yes gene_type:complete